MAKKLPTLTQRVEVLELMSHPPMNVLAERDVERIAKRVAQESFEQDSILPHRARLEDLWHLFQMWGFRIGLGCAMLYLTVKVFG